MATDRIPMTSKVEGVKTPLSNLMPHVLEELGIYLNPRLLRLDVRTLGGHMGYTFNQMANFERECNPTLALLQEWCTTKDKHGRHKTVVDLIELLKEMKRDDAVELLKPYQFSDDQETKVGVEIEVPRSLRIPVSDKVALVIGNQDYQCEKLRGLYYPETDAKDVGTALWNLGFKVVSLVNLTLSEMRIAVLSFCRLLGKGVYAVLYYAGHGYEDSGKNFLVPIDANLKCDRQDSLCIQEIMQTIQECHTALNLFIIDSCRIRPPTRGDQHLFSVKRFSRGNNIFAYSCSSQHATHEEPNRSNGLYAHYLLRHIMRNIRIEMLLMEVAQDVTLANNRYINQRPCHESDAVIDCRLTDPIHPDAQPELEFRERVELWQKAHKLPEFFRVLEKEGLIIDFLPRANFSNVFEIMMVATNTSCYSLERFVMELSIPTPVESKVMLISSDTLKPNHIVKQLVRISGLQKLQANLMAVFKVFYAIDDHPAAVCIEQEIDLGCPLVSSVFVEWDWWISCGRLPPKKSTQM